MNDAEVKVVQDNRDMLLKYVMHVGEPGALHATVKKPDTLPFHIMDMVINCINLGKDCFSNILLKQ